MGRGKDFRIIIFTAEQPVEDEAVKINELLASGINMVHVRKPQYSAEAICRLLDGIKKDFHDRLRLHDHFELLERYNLNGVHLNRRNSIPAAICGRMSKSCHSWEEVRQEAKRGLLDYVTLSPIYNSISKEGYKAGFDAEALDFIGIDLPVIALGGVTPERFKALHEKGFSGAGLLGYIWEGDFSKKIEKLLKYASK